MNSQFDAIGYAQQLATAGVSRPEAEVHARALMEAVGDCTASKTDFATLNETLTAQLAASERRISSRLDVFETKIGVVETRIGTKLLECESNLQIQILKLRAENAEIRGSLKLNRFLSSITLAIAFGLFLKFVT